ncbi:MAG: undecaprenyl/decaprenyl-phosphate alpha-N-acetylglucosaminyl 1-phosphate transferase [Candidatus Moranbacteria bacterium]|nr:undecaprenyl/decaprenyl-phosphate alpha-N-acetylglucosaminyl 1-phosphate transferase [Candidatus Moranbacteria bacterium]
MDKYILPFIEAFFVTIFFIYISIYFAKKISWLGRNASRHIHNKAAYRVGGIAMALSFVLVLIFNKDLVMTPELLGFIVGSLLLVGVGVWDDIKEIFWKLQLCFQVAAACLVFILGVRIYYISNPFTGGIINLDLGYTVLVSIFLVIFWILLVVNAINWADGIDGLSGGVALISIMAIFFLTFKPEVNQPPVAIISSILAGSVFGFLVFNFNPARILAGTSGAMFMGFSLATLSIFSGTKIATAILVLAIPIIDFIWVIGDRIRRKKSIFRPDKNHLHHKLLEIGWSQKKIAVIYYSITLAVSIIALNTRAVGKSLTLFSAVLLMFFAYLLIDRSLRFSKGKE